jgi:hypothetical protein
MGFFFVFFFIKIQKRNPYVFFFFALCAAFFVVFFTENIYECEETHEQRGKLEQEQNGNIVLPFFRTV